MSLQQRDKDVNWHPYTQMKIAEDTIPIVKGKGVYLFDNQGNRYIDAVSSWWVTIHGHAHPYIAQKVSEQLNTLEQVIFAGFTHEPAVQLSENLLSLLPDNQQKVFYSDNGSTAVEVALKMCIQYWYNQGKKKTKILAFKDAYHGDTFGAMSVSGRSVWTKPFGEMLFEVIFMDTPTSENLNDLKAIIQNHSQEIACFIYEPLIQGAAGMLMHKAEDLSVLMKICREQKVLMIQDEVFTGFGRTGKLFAANYLSEKPDIMCFSKGLTGGTMPMGITTSSNEIFEAFLSDDKYKTLFHGHSFTANPLACTAALASMELLLKEDTLTHIKLIYEKHLNFSKTLQQHPKVENVRLIGTILAWEIKNDKQTSYFNEIGKISYNEFLKRGIIMRPLGNVMYLVPPYCITSEELDLVYKNILEVMDYL
ncbi:adenosylmethionine--8-amino-7-oxononanoate transaminase [Myroides ceti]|uniref:Adenosylmethionine-8-amino-7-oxononanoate aminotransferase n=3 Tax=Paenimyroides TaxID=3085669 RepID=A0A3P3W5M9_9FLAO|nr:MULTISPECIES: adenosylmethionine--8-amino-7-oxononanoate transaminase [Paenimyroides]MDN3709917.1 adenosylmethionine--8-amino-7-oxononanoate transaminase [Paenimyroides ceti]MDN3709980.1 adenosylmethionine--8-amino-7-oxononanoate transaminase [Paenimyroides ceti]MDN3710015.1 adenosylmethionine--8-amino-7-oxononanoate transaminase [Paenimyroides ceti]RRJ89687.1 adenosylmethionine--8-amino-7-oxononanoate transaminase [Paenimyroides tangerinum]